MGGNIAFGQHAADRIDLHKVSRKEIVASITTSLLMVNAAFKREYKKDLWAHEINHYLSGSSDALFDKKIKDDAFKAVKPTVGDIDVQVDEAVYKDLTVFLLKYKGDRHGDLTLIDIKHSTDQIITLWRSGKFGINIQIDFELVGFKGNKPNEWARFSRSSHWDDMSIGIKGVAHKYIMRAIAGSDRNQVVIRAKTARSKNKITIDSEMAFSLKGIRQKLKPVLDDSGKHVYDEGIPVYDMIDPKDATYHQNIGVVFETLFRRPMTDSDYRGMQSFVGIVGLMKKYLDKGTIQKSVDRFAHLLWGPKQEGQLMYVKNHRQDFEEKTTMFEYLCKGVGVDPKPFYKMREEYYKNLPEER